MPEKNNYPKISTCPTGFLLDAKERVVRNIDNSIRIYESGIAEAKRGKTPETNLLP